VCTRKRFIIGRQFRSFVVITHHSLVWSHRKEVPLRPTVAYESGYTKKTAWAAWWWKPRDEHLSSQGTGLWHWQTDRQTDGRTVTAPPVPQSRFSIALIRHSRRALYKYFWMNEWMSATIILLSAVIEDGPWTTLEYYAVYGMVLFPMTLSDTSRWLFNDIVQRQLTRKWYKIELYIQWQTSMVHSLMSGSSVISRPVTPTHTSGLASSGSGVIKLWWMTQCTVTLKSLLTMTTLSFYNLTVL